MIVIVSSVVFQNRRVSFAFPLEEKRSISNLKKLENCNELAVPFPANVENEPLERSVRGTPRRFTAIRKKVAGIFHLIMIHTPCIYIVSKLLVFL